MHGEVVCKSAVHQRGAIQLPRRKHGRDGHGGSHGLAHLQDGVRVGAQVHGRVGVEVSGHDYDVHAGLQSKLGQRHARLPQLLHKQLLYVGAQPRAIIHAKLGHEQPQVQGKELAHVRGAHDLGQLCRGVAARHQHRNERANGRARHALELPERQPPLFQLHKRAHKAEASRAAP